MGPQALLQPAGVPAHTFRKMDGLRGMGNGDSPAAAATDPHLKQMLDFVLLGSTSELLLTCGSFGAGAAAWSRGASIRHWDKSCSAPAARLLRM